jgi:predicted nucleic acid-binding protein
MRVLLDTCALSELRRPKPNQQVCSAIADIPDGDLYISVITIGELAKGIALLDSGKRKTTLKQWLKDLEIEYGNHIVPVNAEIANCWGLLAAETQRTGRALPPSDGLIAATAKYQNLQLMTRNIQDFEGLGLSLLNPWDE